MDETWLGPILIVVGIVLVAAVFNVVRDWFKIRRAGKDRVAALEARSAARKHRSEALIVLFAMAITAVIAWLRINPYYGLGILAGAIFLSLATYALVKWGRRKWAHRFLGPAFQLHQSGHSDAAIRHVQNIIASKGPTPERYHLLGLWLVEQERWAESLAAFENAERLGGRDGFLAQNKAAALRRLGRLDECIQIIEGAWRKNPDDFLRVCDYCSVLADLGRLDESREQLQWAERLYEKYGFAGRAAGGQLRQVLEACRQKHQAESP